MIEAERQISKEFRISEIFLRWKEKIPNTGNFKLQLTENFIISRYIGKSFDSCDNDISKVNRESIYLISSTCILFFSDSKKVV